MMMKAITLLLAVLVLAGCNTMEGLGKDIQKGGEKLEKAADH
jgi:predicted small secreted protein